MIIMKMKVAVCAQKARGGGDNNLVARRVYSGILIQTEALEHWYLHNILSCLPHHGDSTHTQLISQCSKRPTYMQTRK